MALRHQAVILPMLHVVFSIQKFSLWRHGKSSKVAIGGYSFALDALEVFALDETLDAPLDHVDVRGEAKLLRDYFCVELLMGELFSFSVMH
jgi:hypothetical protein